MLLHFDKMTLLGIVKDIWLLSVRLTFDTNMTRGCY